MRTNDAALTWTQPSLDSVAGGVAPIHALTGERGIEGSIAIIAESLSNTDYLAVTDTTACNDDRRVTASEVVAEADGVSPFCISPLPHEPRETGNTDAELKGTVPTGCYAPARAAVSLCPSPDDQSLRCRGSIPGHYGEGLLR